MWYMFLQTIQTNSVDLFKQDRADILLEIYYQLILVERQTG